MRSTLFLLAFIATGFTANAQPPLKFHKLTEDDGLSNGFVTSIFQDSRGFLWLGTAKDLNRFDGYGFEVFRYDERDSNSLSNEIIWAIHEDPEGYLWIGTNNGLDRMDLRTGMVNHFRHDPDDPASISNSAPNAICTDKSGNLWVATANGLNRLAPEKQSFVRYFYHREIARTVRDVTLDRDSVLWAGSLDTLYRYDDQKDRFLPYPLPSGNSDISEIRLIYQDRKGFLWIGTQMNGAFCFDPQTERFVEHLQHDPTDLNSLSYNKVSAFLHHQNQLWIGTTGGGLNILDLATRQIHRYTGTPPDPEGVNSETIRSILKDDRGNIWLGTYYDGLYQLKNNQSSFDHYDQSSGLLAKKVQSLAEDNDGKIWVAMIGGLMQFDPEEKAFLRYVRPEDGLPYTDMQKLFIDHTGLIWIGTQSNGITIFDPSRNTFQSVCSNQKPEDLTCLDWLTDFLPEPNGDIWVATQEGLCKWEQSSRTFHSYRLPGKKDSSIPHGENNFVVDLLRDREDRLWIATYGGLNLYQAETDTFSFFPLKHQLVHIYEDDQEVFWVGTTGGLYIFDRDKQTFEVIPETDAKGFSANAMVKDGEGYLWFVTSTDLRRLHPPSGTLSTFNKKDGLGGLGYWTSLLDRKGRLYIGGVEGMTVFHPDSLQSGSPPPPVVLTDFRLFNKKVPVRGTSSDTLSWESPLVNAVPYEKEIRLKYWQNYFSLEFAALDLTAPENNRYQYKLEGYDEDWVFTDAGRRFVTYTNLDPGRYTFRVKGATWNGAWNEEGAVLQIEVLPPWWRSWWAYLGYALFTFLLIRTLYLFQLRRRLAYAEAEQLRELDAAKTRLYTNVTHEFRTPLTVILGMAQQVKDDPKEWFSEGMDAIIRNGKQVLHLVNQMLDLSRLETGHLPVRYQQGDIIPYLGYLVQSFQSYAASRQVNLQFSKEIEHLPMDFDPDLLGKAVNNLLSNAIKFTPAKGTVKVSVKSLQDSLAILFEDDGIGIPEEHLPHIFDRFYQADHSSVREGEGTGIGLALVKEIVDKMRGAIQVRSEAGVGTCFKITLPVRQEAPLMEAPFLAEGSVAEFTFPAILPQEEERAADGPTVLIIEDNADVARYTAGCLQDRYAVQLATDGRAGLEKALENVPDIIICDVMMPEMDGYEVCHRLKNDERTSHIPIIMLTAKADADSRLEGLRRGADAYLAKPFNRQELELRLENLIALRQKIQQHFSSFPENSPAEDPDLYQENAFLQKLKAAVLSRISDEAFGIPELCRELAVSRAQLHRKLKALTGRSASHVVRSIRLQQAKELVLASDRNISEIAYETGFKNPSHFTAVFAEEFGRTPTEMRENRRLKQ